MHRLAPLLLIACAGTEPEPTEETVEVLGRCTYVNSFSDATECKEYVGSGWIESDARDDCATPMPGADPGLFELALPCDRTSILGECILDDGGDEQAALVFPGGPGDSCDGLSLGCGFAGGDFHPSPYCEDGGTVTPSDSAFRPFELICKDPVAGEPAGQSADGKVCTWQAISGATEEGRYYADYADCDAVRTQRPYYPASVQNTTSSDDPRLQDADWVAEYDWVTTQVEASACVCCHTEAESPQGKPSGWYLEAEPIWTDTMDDDAMAMIAGWIDSTAFGAFHPDDNNGFSRDVTGAPSTDPTRMTAFFEAELTRRGLTEADFATATPFGGPLYDQLQYRPSACTNGEGIGADGTITWSGGSARYVYLLEPSAAAPGVPPNLDLPDGTLWRLDVAYDADPLATGIRYGTTPEGTTQRYPSTGSAPALASGQTYYLYVLADVYQPLTRCTFVAP